LQACWPLEPRRFAVRERDRGVRAPPHQQAGGRHLEQVAARLLVLRVRQAVPDNVNPDRVGQVQKNVRELALGIRGLRANQRERLNARGNE
jgi:hypothetical protein